MTAQNEMGETVRGFMVVIDMRSNPAYKRQRKNAPRWMRYPTMSGRKAIECMAKLTRRGFKCFAYTEGFGIEEQLTLQEMKEVIL